MRKHLHTIWFVLSLPFRLFSWIIRKIYQWIKGSIDNAHSLLWDEPEDEPISETFSKTIENPVGLMEHIDALRKHLLRAVIFLAVTTSFSFIYTSTIIDKLAQPVGGLQALRAIDVTEPIGVFMRVALLTGFTIALPYIAFELWLFAAPGLKRRARFFSLAAIPVATIFFTGGMAFAYFFMLPVAIPVLVNFMGFATELRPSSYVRFVTAILFWIGLAFEFPLVIYVLASIRLVRAKVLLDQWRIAVVVIAFLAAAITPTVDPINMALVMAPMIVLYFISIGLAYLAQGREEQYSKAS